MKIAINYAVCDLHGLCAEAAPEIFEVSDESVVLLDAEPDERLRGKAEQAAADCPKAAIAVGD